MLDSPPDPLKQALKDFFELRKSTKGRKYYLRAQALDEHFRKAADICRELNAEAHHYIDAHFDGKDPDKVYPQFLHSGDSRKVYRDYMAASVVPLEDQFKFYNEKLIKYIKTNRSVEDILLDDSYKLPAWFRVIASKEPIQEVIDKYKETARLQVRDTIGLLDFIKTKFDYKRITI